MYDVAYYRGIIGLKIISFSILLLWIGGLSHFFFLVLPRLIVVAVKRLGGGYSEAISLSCSYLEITWEVKTGS